jgi:hypothetical protein
MDTGIYVRPCTLANRFQLSLASLLMNPGAHVSHEQIGSCKDVLVCSVGDDYAEVICSAMSVCQHDGIFLAKWVNVGHYTIQKQVVVVVSVDEGQPRFGIIDKILALKDKVFFVVMLLSTTDYDDHFHAYVVRHFSHKKLVCVALHDLKDHVPLQYHHVDYEGSSRMLISMRYTLF